MLHFYSLWLNKCYYYDVGFVIINLLRSLYRLDSRFILCLYTLDCTCMVKEFAVELPNINYILRDNKILIAYAVRFFCEHALLRLFISPFYWSALSFDYVFLYSTLQHVFSLWVGSLHYQQLKENTSFTLFTPVLLLSFSATANDKTFFTTITRIFKFFLICVGLTTYCLVLNQLASSTQLSLMALAFVWRSSTNSTFIIPNISSDTKTYTTLGSYLNRVLRFPYQPRKNHTKDSKCLKTPFYP